VRDDGVLPPVPGASRRWSSSAFTGPGPTRTYCRRGGSLRLLDASSGSSVLVQCPRDDRQMSFGGSGLRPLETEYGPPSNQGEFHLDGATPVMRHLSARRGAKRSSPAPSTAASARHFSGWSNSTLSVTEETPPLWSALTTVHSDSQLGRQRLPPPGPRREPPWRRAPHRRVLVVPARLPLPQPRRSRRRSRTSSCPRRRGIGLGTVRQTGAKRSPSPLRPRSGARAWGSKDRKVLLSSHRRAGHSPKQVAIASVETTVLSEASRATP